MKIEQTSLEIPEKKHYKIGEAAALMGVKPYILRYWESEFQALAPRKTSTRHRMYSRDDIALLSTIKSLLYDQKYTIAGAQKRLAELRRDGAIGAGALSADSSTDPLEGARVAALEQQLQSLTARLEGALDERREALETAKMTAEAIGDVERAHEEARLQRDALEERAAQDRLQASQDLSEMQAMLDEAQLEIHRLETERAEMLAVAETSPRPDDSGEAVISNLVDIDAMRSAHEAAMARAKRTERELRKRASHINTNQEMILRHLRAEVVSLSNVFEAAGS